MEFSNKTTENASGEPVRVDSEDTIVHYLQIANYDNETKNADNQTD